MGRLVRCLDGAWEKGEEMVLNQNLQRAWQKGEEMVLNPNLQRAAHAGFPKGKKGQPEVVWMLLVQKWIQVRWILLLRRARLVPHLLPLRGCSSGR